MLQVARTDGTHPEWGTVGEVEEPWGCRLYTKDAQEELLDLYYNAILQAAPTGIEAEFTRERLGEEYAIGCIAWYEIQIAAVMRVLADPMAPREQKEFFRHVLARHKIILTATGAPKMLMKMARGQYVRK